MKAKENDFFVYQNWFTETLYSSGLSEKQADEDCETLDSLIESGGCGSGCACIGRLSAESDVYVAKRLGLIP